jgi:hypothetical protein
MLIPSCQKTLPPLAGYISGVASMGADLGCGSHVKGDNFTSCEGLVENGQRPGVRASGATGNKTNRAEAPANKVNHYSSDGFRVAPLYHETEAGPQLAFPLN